MTKIYHQILQFVEINQYIDNSSLRKKLESIQIIILSIYQKKFFEM